MPCKTMKPTNVTKMIQLCVVKIADRHWEITTTDMLDKYEANWTDKESKMIPDDKAVKNWLEDVRGK